MKQLIENLKIELKLRETQLENADAQFVKTHLNGMIYGLKTAIIFAEEGVDSNTIVRFGK